MATYTDAQILEAIRAAIYGTATRNAKQMQINGRSISSLSLRELIAAEKHFADKVAASEGLRQSAVAKFRTPG